MQNANILKNKIFISTRPLGKSEDLRAILKQEEAYLLELPAISIHTVLHSSEILIALKELKKYNWIVFTSVNGVISFFENYIKAGFSLINFPKDIQFASIGNNTAKAILDFGQEVAFESKNLVGDIFAENLVNHIGGKDGVNILLPSSNLWINNVPDILAKAGSVKRIVVYENTAVQKMDEQVWQVLLNRKFDWILFYSPSAVRRVLSQLKPEFRTSLPIACIGPSTAQEVSKFNINSTVVATEYNTEGMVKEIKEYYNKPDKGRN